MSTETAIKQLVRFSAGDGRVRTWSEAHALVTAKPALTDPTSPIARAYEEYDRVGTSIADALCKMAPDPVRGSGAVVSDSGPASGSVASRALVAEFMGPPANLDRRMATEAVANLILAEAEKKKPKVQHDPDAERKPARGKPMSEEAMSIIASRGGSSIAELRQINRRIYGV